MLDRIRSALLVSTLAILALSAGAHGRAQAPLDALLARFRAVPGFQARFHETKRVALLRRPIESDGTLHFAPPARFARHVSGASWSSVIVDGTHLTLASATERRELEVSQSGGARPYLEGFVGLLRGDRAALDRSFTTTFVTGDPWELTLVPRAAGAIRSVVVRGRDTRIEGYRIVEASGDTTEVTLSDVDASHALSPADARRAFRPHAP